MFKKIRYTIKGVAYKIQQLQDRRFKDKVMSNQELQKTVFEILKPGVVYDITEKLRPVIRKEEKKALVEQMSENPTKEIFIEAAKLLFSEHKIDRHLDQVVPIVLQNAQYKQIVLEKAANIEARRQEEAKKQEEKAKKQEEYEAKINANLEKDDTYQTFLQFIQSCTSMTILKGNWVCCGDCRVCECDTKENKYFIYVQHTGDTYFISLISEGDPFECWQLELYTTAYGVKQIQKAVEDRKIQIEMDRRQALTDSLKAKLMSQQQR